MANPTFMYLKKLSQATGWLAQVRAWMQPVQGGSCRTFAAASFR
jgi:hypothetical protein